MLTIWYSLHLPYRLLRINWWKLKCKDSVTSFSQLSAICNYLGSIEITMWLQIWDGKVKY